MNMNKILNNNLTTVGISYQHFKGSRYTTHTIFFSNLAHDCVPIFIQNRVDLAHRAVIQLTIFYKRIFKWNYKDGKLVEIVVATSDGVVSPFASLAEMHSTVTPSARLPACFNWEWQPNGNCHFHLQSLTNT